MSVKTLAEPLTGETMANFVNLEILRMGTSMIQDAISEARNLTYADTPGITAVQYVALMDNTCAFCESLDGMIIDTTTPEGQMLEDKYSPAQHLNCNCFYIGLYSDSPYKADNTGFEEKWQDTFIKQHPDLKELTKAEIIEKFGHYNIYTRGQYWIKEPGFNVISQEKMHRTQAKKMVTFTGDIAEQLGLTPQEIPATWI